MSELSSGKRAALTVAFLLTGLCLCLLFLLVYTEGDRCRYCEYALVVLCALFAFRIRSLDAEGSIAVAALFFTAVADFFLVALKDEQRLVGMAVFCCAQIFWCVRLLMLEKPNRRGGHLLTLLLLAAALGIASLILCRGADALLLICSLYAALLLSTALFSWFTLKNYALLSV